MIVNSFWYFLVAFISITITVILREIGRCKHEFVQVKEWQKEELEETTYVKTNQFGRRVAVFRRKTWLIQQDRCRKCGATNYHSNVIKEEYT